MASSLPIVRQIAWLSLVPQLAIFLMLVVIASAVGSDDAVLPAAAAYLLLSLGLRGVLARHHRLGMKRFKQERFADAVPEFQRSYEFFRKHEWLDRWRAVTLFSVSRVSYREMALLNQAFCLGQSGEREQSLELYRRTLAEFPDSKLALMTLRLLDPNT